MPPYIPLSTKYNLPVPRYTSYPTVPFWKEGIAVKRWEQAFSDQFQIFNSRDGISLYLHLPFCESLCTYCGCNKKITTSHAVEDPYITTILKEWGMYKKLMKEPPVIKELHLGGGTPTFFSPVNLETLINGILKDAILHPRHAFSLEGHPNNTTREHLETLYRLGFRRISYGVQDTNSEGQRIINRIQPFENVRQATENARAVGFSSVNFDLVYGLPRQNATSLAETIQECLTLRPDRIAFYSYAHTPWANAAQRLFDETDLPSPEEKLALYLKGKQIFLENGYTDIGMDHFALPSDELFQAWQNGSLHRNFMGYTAHKTSLLLGLGVSSISDVGIAFAQNDKALVNYYRDIDAGELAVKKGYFLSGEDLVFKEHILDIACRNRTAFNGEYADQIEQYSLPVLRELQKDGLVIVDSKGVEVTSTGRSFIRNIAKAFDLHLLRDEAARARGEQSVLIKKPATPANPANPGNPISRPRPEGTFSNAI